VDAGARSFLIAMAWTLSEFDDFHLLGRFSRRIVAHKVFGVEPVEEALQSVLQVMHGWGYQDTAPANSWFRAFLIQALLINRSPLLDDLTTDALDRLRLHPSFAGKPLSALFGLQRALAALGVTEPPKRRGVQTCAEIVDTPQPWAAAVEKWFATSTLSRTVRRGYRAILARAGRWLAVNHPEVTEPAQWTRQTCAAWVAAVDRMNRGEYSQDPAKAANDPERPLSPLTKISYLRPLRVFFNDLQEWEWIHRRFDPRRAFETPRTLRAMAGPNPRVIADDVWAKLLWAGINLQPEDLSQSGYRYGYPIEMMRAITSLWLFAGQRSDEIARLRVGCVRWQHNERPVAADAADVLVDDAVCLLDIPTHKTGTAFTKPVDPILGQAVEIWQAVRPHQPRLPDRKTGELIDMLFADRAKPLSTKYINDTIIPALCRKAGVPDTDVRGKITSHRARSTIASQLYNAKEPMTLFELQAWLGHKTPQSTAHYAKITPNTLSNAYRDAGYFGRSLRTIEVLLDRDAVASGAAATGQPWQYFDLGHGYCTYTFFEQCQHRMACARCDFYTPKQSSRALLLEAKTNLQRMLVSIPLTDDERAAVDDEQAVDQILERLADVPTPAGPTPRQLLPLLVVSPINLPL
jgi:integrase